jgi:hypothetical protein
VYPEPAPALESLELGGSGGEDRRAAEAWAVAERGKAVEYGEPPRSPAGYSWGLCSLVAVGEWLLSGECEVEAVGRSRWDRPGPP